MNAEQMGRTLAHGVRLISKGGDFVLHALMTAVDPANAHDHPSASNGGTGSGTGGGSRVGTVAPRYEVRREARLGDGPLHPLKMCFTEAALTQLLRTVGNLPPETGAKLFAPKDRCGVDVVEFDERGSAGASGTVYAPSTEFGNERCDYWLHQPEEEVRLWIGDAHSHPGGMGYPSRESGPGLGDLGYVRQVFAENEWMQAFYMPILTHTGDGGPVTIWPWIVERNRPDRPYLAELRVVPAATFPELPYNPEWLRQLELAASAPTEVPAPSTPEVAESPAGLEIPDAPMEPHAPAGLSVGAGDRGPGPNTEGDTDSQAPEAAFEPAALFRRQQGILPASIRAKTVVVVGCGAGSAAVEVLARHGVGTLRLVDLDRVEAPNLSRTSFRLSQRGMFKTEALAENIREIGLGTRVETLSADLCALAPERLRRLIEGADLLIAGTDHFPAQSLLNRLSQESGIPAVFIGIYARGLGGQVVWSLPGRTPCYACVAQERYEAFAAGGPDATDLNGAGGAMADCQFVDNVALKVSLALLSREHPETQFGRFFPAMDGRTQVVIRTHPEFAWGSALWDAMLADLPREPRDLAAELREEALLAMDTLWLRTYRRPDCPECRARSGDRQSPAAT